MANKAWKLDHDPTSRPLGCNGKYGDSGRKLHRRKGEEICSDCRESANHVVRERRRGSPSPRRINPCGTAAAARRHRLRGEPVDLLCRAAEANYHAENRRKHREAARNRAASSIPTKDTAA